MHLFKIYVYCASGLLIVAPFCIGYFVIQDDKITNDNPMMAIIITGVAALLWPLVCALGFLWLSCVAMAGFGADFYKIKKRAKRKKLREALKVESTKKQEKLSLKLGD